MSTVLVIGQGGREHALCWRLRLEGHDVHAAPGNDGMSVVAKCHAIAPHRLDAFVDLALGLAADLVVIGPESPLVAGLGDRLRAAGLPTLGPSARAAELEGSKAAAKAFMQRYAIPTAPAVEVHDLAEGLAAMRGFEAPPVVKADGLAAGKGVTVCETFADTEAALRACLLEGRFGSAGETVVLEERLYGREMSLFLLTDGERATLFDAAEDHKRLGDADTGPNTGGMGAYAPTPFFTEIVCERAFQTIVGPTLAGLREEQRPFVGVLFVGLMVDAEGYPRVIEYNCRFGDPEAQALLFGLQDSIYEPLLAAATDNLTDGRLASRPAAAVVLAAAGYPTEPRQGDAIRGLDGVEHLDDVIVFHAGTRRRPEGGFETAGGRVLTICGRADRLNTALDRAYAAVDLIEFDGVQLRRDIGHRIR